jgi:hypothetical protein
MPKKDVAIEKGANLLRKIVNRIKLVKPDKAKILEDQLINVKDTVKTLSKCFRDLLLSVKNHVFFDFQSIDGKIRAIKGVHF